MCARCRSLKAALIHSGPLMRCQRCGHDSPSSSQFCQQCGQQLGASQAGNPCGRCGVDNMPHMRFCTECGNPLPAAGPAASVSAPPLAVSAVSAPAAQPVAPTGPPLSALSDHRSARFRLLQRMRYRSGGLRRSASGCRGPERAPPRLSVAASAGPVGSGRVDAARGP